MGNEASTTSSGPRGVEDSSASENSGIYTDGDAEDGDAFSGFRVLGIQERSPAADVGFVSFFDFIMAANGIRLDVKDSTFMELIAQSEETPMQLDVYNLKSQTMRQLSLTPSRRWAGKGLLGVTIRFDSYEHAEDQLLHVLDVVKNSPAAEAGLCAGVDYLLGTPERVFRDPEDLADEVLDALNDSIVQCYIYNTEKDQVRIVSISPSDQWGGAGVLGAEIGHGVLHRLPQSCRGTVGSSIGFVSLANDAKAATDPYLRHELVTGADHASDASITSLNAPAPTESDTTHGSEGAVRDTQADADHTEAITPTASKTESLAPDSSNQIDHHYGLESVSTATAATPGSHTQSSQAAPSSMARYAARIDPMFPMSTIEVVAANPTAQP